MNKTRLSHVIFLVVCALWVQSSLAQDYTLGVCPQRPSPARAKQASVRATKRRLAALASGSTIRTPVLKSLYSQVIRGWGPFRGVFARWKHPRQC